MTLNMTTADLRHPVLDLETAAMHRWLSGDPSGFLEISAPDVVYFDPTLHSRLDGIDALTAYYEAARGQIFADRFSFVNPLVQEHGDLAVLTFNFLSWSGDDEPIRWNCTEVYRKAGATWQIIQTHWSFTAAPPA